MKWMSQRIECNAADSLVECHYTETGMYRRSHCKSISIWFADKQCGRADQWKRERERKRYFKQILHKSNVKPKQINAESVVFFSFFLLIPHRQEIDEAMRQNASQPFLMSPFFQRCGKYLNKFCHRNRQIDGKLPAFHRSIYSVRREGMDRRTEIPPEANVHTITTFICCLLIRKYSRVEWQFRFSNGIELNSSWHWDHSESLFLSFHFIDCSVWQGT